MDVGERIAVGFAEAERTRRVNVPGAEVLEIDGLLLAFANVSDPPVNALHVLSEPADPVAAFTAAEHAFRERDRPIGVDVAVGRHPSVDDAIREIGLTRLFAWPGMAVDVAALPEAVLPEGIRVEPVTTSGAAATRTSRWGSVSEQEIAERFCAAPPYPGEGGRSPWRGTGTIPSAWRPGTRTMARSGSSCPRRCYAWRRGSPALAVTRARVPRGSQLR
jgi:hypothetical protein